MSPQDNLKIKKEAVLTGHANPIYSLCEAYDEHIIFSAGGDKMVAAWNLKAFKGENFSIQFEQAIYTVFYDKETGILYAGNAIGGIHVIDLNIKKEIKLLQNHNKAIFDIKKIDNTLVVASADGHVSFTDLKEHKAFKITKICSQKVRQIHIDELEKKIYFAAGDCSVRIFESENFSQEKIIGVHDLSCNSVIINPNNRDILSGGRDAHINIVDKNFEQKKNIAAHNFAVYDFAFSPNKKLMATASRDKTIKIWDAENYDILKRIDRLAGGHRNSVNRVLWTSFNDYLISTGDDGQIIIWSIGE